MTQQFGAFAFGQAETFLGAPRGFQALAEKGVAASKQVCDKATVSTQDQARALTEIVDAAWSSAKLLNEKVLENWAVNVAATFSAVQQITAAKSLPEIAKAQSDFMRMYAAQTTRQGAELVGLAARASEHVFETVKAVATKPLGQKN